MQQKLFLAFVLVIALCLIGSLSASAQGSGPQASSLGNTITFQGHLKDGSTPTDGNYDFQFKLFDSASGGSQWGSTLEKGNIPVSAGVFTVQLDFGAAYRGQALWLEVGVRAGDSTGAYTVLSPRQELTAAPYANYSLHVPWSGLDGTPPLDILQARVSQACGAGSSIRAIAKDGTVTCEVDDGQAFTAGLGLTLSGGQFSVNFAGSGSATTVARSDHNHLGQVWTGNENSLTIGGSFNSTNNTAPLMLSNTSANGLQVVSAAWNGIAVNSASNNGVAIASAGEDGVFVGNSGLPSSSHVSTAKNGIEIAGAQGEGLYVGRADLNGLYVLSSGTNGLAVLAPGTNGVYIGNAIQSGVSVYTAGAPTTTQSNSVHNGFEVAGAAGNGLYVGHADLNGMSVYSTAQDGMEVQIAGNDGLHVITSGMDGLHVGWAGADGVFVDSAGNPTNHFESNQKNGFEVAGAQGNGLYVGRADMAGAYVGSAVEGFHVGTASADGMYVGNAGSPSTFNNSSQSNGFEVAGAQGYGLYVGRADLDGIYVQSSYWHGLNVADARVNGVYVTGAGNNGINVHGANLAGYFDGAIQVTGGCTGCVISAFGVNTSSDPLEPGDVVTVSGVQPSGSDSTPVLWNVAPAAAAQAVVGVVQGKAEMVTEEVKREDEIGKILVPREGTAAPGEYVTIIIYGPAQVKASGAVSAGMRLASGDLGTARVLKTTEVNGIQVSESAPTIGIALDAPGEDGLAWVLVNPQ